MTDIRREETGASPIAGRAPSIDVLGNPEFAAVARRVTITVEEAASLLGIGRSAAYDAARRGQLPTRRLGRRLFVPVPAFFAWLGLTSEASE